MTSPLTVPSFRLVTSDLALLVQPLRPQLPRGFDGEVPAAAMNRRDLGIVELPREGRHAGAGRFFLGGGAAAALEHEMEERGRVVGAAMMIPAEAS